MPWSQTTPMRERTLFIADHLRGTRSVIELCAEYGISRKTGYKLRRRYQAEGVLCVEMEAAALFAVAKVRGLQVASAFTISDSLADLVWNPQFHGPPVQAGLITLYEAAVSALQAVKEAR